VRILLVAPWFRTLAGAWAEPMRAAGHEVLVVTSPRHFEQRSAGEPEIVLAQSPRSVAGIKEFRQLARTIREFRPDVVLADELRDPRLLALAPRTPLVVVVHDAQPHDAAHRRPWRHDAVVRIEHRHAERFAVFSESVRAALGTRTMSPIDVVALPSEMRDDEVGPFVESAGRRDFALVGRLGPYKNIPVVFDAWRRHTESPAYRGDRLLVVGDGEPGVPLPPHAERTHRRFAFADIAGSLAAAKGSLALYRAGSQSGVQRLSQQVGVSCVVSDVGGLAEALPPGEPAFAPDDRAGVAARLDALADPVFAAERGRIGQEYYRDHQSAARSAEQLLAVLERARRR
jgi:glycosyltransferase involved in cell wall biosynthesis